jgi:hypothetical protein
LGPRKKLFNGLLPYSDCDSFSSSICDPFFFLPRPPSSSSDICSSSFLSFLLAASFLISFLASSDGVAAAPSFSSFFAEAYSEDFFLKNFSKPLGTF